MNNIELVDNQLDESEESQQGAAQAVTDAEIESTYAHSSFRVIYQSNNYFLPQIKDLIKAREIINLRPEYQRRLRWSNTQKSLLIESLLLNVPIPPVFLYESELARYEVMDGQQRLNAVYEFLSNDFELSGLESLKVLSGKRYNALPPRLKRGLDRASISTIVLLHETESPNVNPTAVRRYVFQRLNTGGKALNAQEIRNSLYGGKFNNLIVELTRLPKFCNAFGIPPYVEDDPDSLYENPQRKRNALYKKMGDCQLVLRFFAFMNDNHIKGAVRSILDNTMMRCQASTETELQGYRSAFAATLDTAVDMFGDHVFTLPPANNVRRVSVALYDAIMIAIFRNAEKAGQYIEHSNDISSRIDLITQQDPGLMTGRANTADSIKQRINAVIEVFNMVVP